MTEKQAVEKSKEMQLRLLLRSVYVKGHQDGNMKTAETMLNQLRSLR